MASHLSGAHLLGGEIFHPRKPGSKILKAEDPTPATLVCIVNPCNPTGDYLHVDELKRCDRRGLGYLCGLVSIVLFLFRCFFLRRNHNFSCI